MTNAASQDEYPRPLTEREAEILDFGLGIEEPRLAPLREQARTAAVARTCACGCETIDLAVDRDSGNPANLCSPVVSADSRSVKGDESHPIAGAVRPSGLQTKVTFADIERYRLPATADRQLMGGRRG